MAARNMMIPSLSTRNLLLSTFRRNHHRLLSSSTSSSSSCFESNPNPPYWPPPAALCFPDNMWTADLGRWVFRMKNPKLEGLSEKEFYKSLVKQVGQIIGSEAEAEKRIYFICTGVEDGLGFGAYLDKKNKDKIREGLEVVVNSFPDVYYDSRENDPKTRPLRT